MDKKIVVILMVLAVGLTALAMAALFVPAVGEWFHVNLGGVGAGFLTLVQMPFIWALEGGPQTLIVYAASGIVTLALIYATWHYDLPDKITGTTASTNSNLTGYTPQREPEEPETLSVPKKA